jgi:hypothetical protein
VIKATVFVVLLFGELDDLQNRAHLSDVEARICDSARDLLRQSARYQDEGNWEGVREVLGRLTRDPAIDVEVRAFYLVELYHRQRSAPDQMDDAYLTLQYLRELKQADWEDLFHVDIELAKFLAQVEPQESFHPTFSDKQGQFERLFSLYSPYSEDIIRAHLEYARELEEEYQGDTPPERKVKCAELALAQAEEARKIVAQLRDNPSLADNADGVLKRLDDLEHFVNEQSRWINERNERIVRSDSAPPAQDALRATNLQSDASADDTEDSTRVTDARDGTAHSAPGLDAPLPVRENSGELGSQEQSETYPYRGVAIKFLLLGLICVALLPFAMRLLRSMGRG